MIGIHLLIDLYGISAELLNDSGLLSDCLAESASVCGLNPLGDPHMHTFEGGGVTGVILLSESHVALHTYPEHGFIAIDVFSCGPAGPEKAVQVFRDLLHPTSERITRNLRGTEIL